MWSYFASSKMFSIIISDVRKWMEICLHKECCNESMLMKQHYGKYWKEWALESGWLDLSCKNTGFSWLVLTRITNINDSDLTHDSGPVIQKNFVTRIGSSSNLLSCVFATLWAFFVCLLSLLFHCCHNPPKTSWLNWKPVFRKMATVDMVREG